MYSDRPDLEYRPASYWDVDGLLRAPIANVKGSMRQWLLRTGDVSFGDGALDTRLLARELSGDLLKRWLACGPEFWGGEFLPDFYRGEVEIARIEYPTKTRDVVSIRARTRQRQIFYRVVDEYDTYIAFYPRTSDEPLSLDELIQLIDSADYGGEYQGLADRCAGEIVVSSEFYRQLSTYYVRRAILSDRQ